MENVKNIFEVATRQSYRFNFKGLISVEDLWNLPLKDLDSVFKTLNSALKQVKEESLLNIKTQQDEELDTKIQIVKYIVQVKLAEDELRTKAKDQKIQKQKILELIASKKDNELGNKSVEELEKILEEIGK